MKKRIEAIRQREGMTSAEFAEAIAVGRATVTHILQGRNKPSLEVMLRIYKRFPDINLDWLLTGEGSMYAPSKPKNYQPDLFSSAENCVNPSKDTVKPESVRENLVKTDYSILNSPVKEVVKYIEKAPRKITEIRIFFDDNTYEIFKPEN